MSQQKLVFVSSGVICRRLGIAHTMLYHMLKYIPHVLVGKTHLFPLAYIDAFAAYAKNAERVKTSTAVDFWQTPEAYRMYRTAVCLFEEELDRPTLTGKELSQLFGISYNTISNWVYDGVLELQHTAQRHGKRKVIVFSGGSLKRALAWQIPLTPPGLPRMFILATEAKERLRQQGREAKDSVTGPFGHLQNPGKGSNFPLLYVAALLENTSGPLTRQCVTTFNATDVARGVMIKAKEEFERRLAERQQASPYPGGLLPLATVAWLFNVDIAAVRAWCERGVLPYTLVSNAKLISPVALSARIKWVLPTK